MSLNTLFCYLLALFFYSCITGIPLRPTTLQKLIQAAKSSVYKLPYELAYSERSIDLWRRELNTEQITEIEQICGPVMAQLGYIRETKSVPVNET